MDFLVLLLSKPLFLYSGNAYDFLFVLLEHIHMPLKPFSFSQLASLHLALYFLFSLIVVSYLVLSVNNFFILITKIPYFLLFQLLLIEMPWYTIPQKGSPLSVSGNPFYFVHTCACVGLEKCLYWCSGTLQESSNLCLVIS